MMALASAGVSQVDIAKRFGVTRQYVNKLAKKAGHVSAMTIINDNLPWKVGGAYQDNTIYQGIRLIAHYNLEGERAFEGRPTNLRKLKAIMRKLHVFQQVVDFDPEYPAVPGVVNGPGFAYVPRTPRDKDLAIKIKPSLRFTRLGETLWKLPPML
ncbi:hypothetical protein [uncultured Corynebacterium sp.]|uniref:hypothetical protein n=1 Tax=uncultured Corynebacterium sp. TaxID=159447 RepID=UPI0025E7D585|nr:hypothetical protein [uncultured Corynebacterium sp.]